jgi:hypothetical protein
MPPTANRKRLPPQSRLPRAVDAVIGARAVGRPQAQMCLQWTTHDSPSAERRSGASPARVMRRMSSLNLREPTQTRVRQHGRTGPGEARCDVVSDRR